MCDQLAKTYNFMLENARLLERRVFEARFLGIDPTCVCNAVRAYQNPDGGLGHALEPDLRCAESQPLFAEFGLAVLRGVGLRDCELAQELCTFLAGVANEHGLVPPLLESALVAPHAAHWRGPIQPDLNPTVGICGLMLYHGAKHNWLTLAIETCSAMLLSNPPLEAHTLLGACRLAETHPDAKMGEHLGQMIVKTLPKARFFIPHGPVQTYGLTPLHFAPTPDSTWRSMFTDEQIDSHLADLAGKQQPDGGWPITWRAPSPYAECEWRGRWTLEAVSVLAAYGHTTSLLHS